MPINTSRSVLFLHIPKTAGTSLVETARRLLPAKDIVSHGDFIDKAPDDLLQVPFVSGHFGYHFAKPLMAGRYTVSILRNPLERVVSFYYFCRRADPDVYEVYRIARRYSLEAFLELGLERGSIVNQSLWNLQTRLLASGWAYDDTDEERLVRMALGHLEEFSHVGFTETFARDYPKIVSAIGWPVPPSVPVENKTPGRLAVAELSASALDLIRLLTRADRKLYQAAWQRRSGPGTDGKRASVA